MGAASKPHLKALKCRHRPNAVAVALAVAANVAIAEMDDPSVAAGVLSGRPIAGRCKVCENSVCNSFLKDIVIGIGTLAEPPAKSYKQTFGWQEPVMSLELISKFHACHSRLVSISG